MVKIFNECFAQVKIPKMLTQGIIIPIPKDKTKDMRDPMSYIGITITCIVCKVYCSVLNYRLFEWARLNNIICEEQNGFGANRSCVDHLVSLTSIVGTRKSLRKDTIVDLSKAYDKVNRNKLWQRLTSLGLSQLFTTVLKSLYKDVQCCVGVNGVKSRWFNVGVGLKQGYMLSPLLFNLVHK